VNILVVKDKEKPQQWLSTEMGYIAGMTKGKITPSTN
jgi:hypothetical protein